MVYRKYVPRLNRAYKILHQSDEKILSNVYEKKWKITSTKTIILSLHTIHLPYYG